MFKCPECGKETMLVYYLSEYGQTAKGVKDNNEYCRDCFDKKYEEKQNDENDKK